MAFRLYLPSALRFGTLYARSQTNHCPQHLVLALGFLLAVGLHLPSARCSLSLSSQCRIWSSALGSIVALGIQYQSFLSAPSFDTWTWLLHVSPSLCCLLLQRFDTVDRLVKKGSVTHRTCETGRGTTQTDDTELWNCVSQYKIDQADGMICDNDRNVINSLGLDNDNLHRPWPKSDACVRSWCIMSLLRKLMAFLWSMEACSALG